MINHFYLSVFLVGLACTTMIEVPIDIEPVNAANLVSRSLLNFLGDN